MKGRPRTGVTIAAHAGEEDVLAHAVDHLDGDEDAAAVIMQKNLRGIAARRKTLRQVEDGSLGGFIRVFVRVRPLGEGRGEKGDRIQVDPRAGKVRTLEWE